MKRLVGFCLLLCSVTSFAQVDTSFVYNTSTAYGTLDIRIRKSSSRYYYLQENITYSFRESAPGVKTNTYQDMTSWDSSPYAQGNLREKNGSSDYFVMNYRLLFPVNYDPSYSEGYPLIVMLHGAGERANCWDQTCFWSDRNYKPTTNTPPAPTTVDHGLLNNDLNLVHGGQPHLNARNLAAGKLPGDPNLHPRAWPGFVLFPQNMNGWESTPTQDAIRLIRLAVKKYKINPNRIYVHGLSNGGAGVYEIIKRAPWLFAAGLPMSAINDGSINSKLLTPSVAHIPLWTFQGGQDTAPLPSKTEGYVKKFKEAGMNVRYTLYKNLGHGTWNTAYEEPDFFTWMLSKNKSNLHVFYNNPSVCATTQQGAKLGLSAGFLAYQWEKDGVIMPGVNSNELVATEAGVYRARFSRKANPTEADWNQWSQPVTVTMTDPVKPQINVYGTHLMRGPDSNSFYNTVQLKSDGVNDKYYWYKNGALVNIPNTSLDDTTRTYTVYSGSASGNGKFTLVTKGLDNCPTPPSDTLYLFFGNSAATMPNGNQPSQFTGTAISNSTVDLYWQDNSSIETGFEIWRRKPGGDFFRLAGKVPANTTYFRDTNLEPSVAYQYKVRAVNATTRSTYAPSNSTSTNLVITTQADTTPPGAPSGFVVTGNTTSTISLKWSPSLDDTGIRRYILTYGDSTIATPTKATEFTINNLPMNTAYNFYLTAEDLGGNLSQSVGPVYGSTYVTGLTYGHSTGAWTDLDQITNWATPEFTGTVPNFTLAPRTQEDFFNFEFTGYLYISQSGSYQFRTVSDDGSKLKLNNVLIVDNDGVHGNVTKESSAQQLTHGPQLLNVQYFEYQGGQSLTVQYRGPDTFFAWVTIPNSALRSGSAPPVAAASIASAQIVRDPMIESAATVRVFPNPSSAENLNIQIEGFADGPLDVHMTDMMGRPYFEKTLNKADVSGPVQIVPSRPMQNGLYILVVRQGANALKQKVIIKN